MTMRLVTAVAVLTSAGIHLTLWFQGMRDVEVIGPAFLLNVVSGVVIALLLVYWRHWFAAFLAAGFGLATLSAFTMASTVGLFGDHPTWEGFYVFAAAGAEVAAIVGGCVLALEDPEPKPVVTPSGTHRRDASIGR